MDWKRIMQGTTVPPLDGQPQKRNQSLGEEIANSISHGFGLIGVITGVPFLMIRAMRCNDGSFIAGATVFSASMVLLYLSSTLYHAFPPGKNKRILRVVEHSMIYVLIAGTYTPLSLSVLRGGWGWSLFGIIWGLAVIGILMKIVYMPSRQIVSTGLYLFMGWLLIIAIKPLLSHMPFTGVIWLIAGGIAYTVGVVFFVTDSKLRYGHFIWHLFVITGSTCHYFAVLWHSV
jgi:hemolysin III